MKRERGYIEGNGARLWFEDVGEGTSVVFVHSGFVDSRIWEDQVDVLTAAKYRVIRYDVRGFGQSSKPEGPYKNEEDLLRVLNERGIEKAIINGCSMGGSIAVDFTLSYPERVSALILTGASMGGFPIDPAPEDVTRSAIGRSVMARDENYEESLAYLLNEPMWRQDDPATRERVEKMFRESDLRWLFAGYPKPLDPTAYERLEQITVPTLVLVGERDPKPIHDIAKTYSERIPQARYEWMAGVGHLPSVERPAAYNQRIIAFLDALSNK